MGLVALSNELAEVSERFCSVIDRAEEFTEIQFLREVDILLPLAYSKARQLPYLAYEDGDESWDVKAEAGLGGHNKRWNEARTRIQSKLGEHSWFRHLHDPFDSEDQEIHVVDLADELAEVYVGLANGLYLHRQGDVKNAFRAWNSGAETFWGDNAVDAIPAVSRLIRHHYDEDDEVFDI